MMDLKAKPAEPEASDPVEYDEPDLEIQSDRESSIGFYLTPEKARDDVYDQFAAHTSEVEDYDAFIEGKIEDRVNALGYASENFSDMEQIRFAAESMDDEATWLASRYPQVLMGTLLGVGGAAYSAMKGDVELGSAMAFGSGTFMTYTAFNGTSETIDKVLTFKDNIDEQQEIWEQALDDHERNGFEQEGTPTKEVNQKMLHPVGADHNISYKNGDGDWNNVEFAETFSELFDKHGKKEVFGLLYHNARTVFPQYLKRMADSSTEGTRTRLKGTAEKISEYVP